jgi:hypothetical protein
MNKDDPANFKNQVNNLKEREEPFFEKSIICTINSLIEILDLPYSKIKSPNRDLIGIKILELSKGKNFPSMVIYQSFLLQYLVLKLCPDDRSLERVLKLAIEKYRHYLESGEFT